METYAYIYGGDIGEEQQNNIKFISKKREIGPEQKNGYCIKFDNVPIVFSAYAQWAWKYHGKNDNQYYV